MKRHRSSATAVSRELSNDPVLRWAEQIAEDPQYRHEALLAHFMELKDQYAHLVKRFMKVARISDEYQLSLKEHNSTLDDAARKDYLTGLSNRRDMLEKLRSERNRARRNREPFSIVLGDLDGFKAINDEHGHQAGDSLLGAVADCIRSSIRSEDHCARWGGEEIMLALIHTDTETGTAVAEKLRRKIEKLDVDYNGEHLRITMSMGVASYEPSTDNEIDALIRAADEALFQAKRRGKNRVCSSVS